MKVFAIVVLFFSLSAVADSKPCKTVTDYSDTLSQQFARLFPTAQEEQLKTLSTYAFTLKSQIARLMSGISQEGVHSTPKTMKLYKDYLGDLLFSYTYVMALHNQLKAYDMKTACSVFQHQEIEITVDKLLRSADKAESHGRVKDLLITVTKETMSGIAENALQDIAIGATRQFKTMLVQRAVSSGLRAIVSSVNGRTVRKLIVGAAKGVVVGLVIDQLKGGKVPETTQWMDLIRDDLELQLNPEWMREAGLKLQIPWYWHMMTWRNEEKALLGARTVLCKRAENTFINRIRYISHVDENDRKYEDEQRFPREYAESTGVANYSTHEESTRIPRWAVKE